MSAEMPQEGFRAGPRRAVTEMSYEGLRDEYNFLFKEAEVDRLNELLFYQHNPLPEGSITDLSSEELTIRAGECLRLADLFAEMGDRLWRNATGEGSRENCVDFEQDLEEFMRIANDLVTLARQKRVG